MRINHNIPALRALHQLTMNNSKLDKTLERLSSGLRINHSSDDAAGLAITQKMDTQVRGLDQAKRNTMDGISLIQTAEGALNEVHSMLQRIRELSVQASNGTYDDKDRKAIQEEVRQLQKEIQRISDNIEFNERKLLNGEIDRRAFPNFDNIAKIVSLSDTVKPGNYKINIVSDATKAKITSTKECKTIQENGVVSLNGEEVKINKTDTPEMIFAKLRGLAEKVGVNLKAVDNAGNSVGFALNAGVKLQFESKHYGSDYKLDLKGSNEVLDNLGLSSQTVKGKDVEASIDSKNSDFSPTATVSTKGNIITVTDTNGFEIKFEAVEGIAGNNEVYKEGITKASAGTGGMGLTNEKAEIFVKAFMNALGKGKNVDEAKNAACDAISVGSNAPGVANTVDAILNKAGDAADAIKGGVGTIIKAGLTNGDTEEDIIAEIMKKPATRGEAISALAAYKAAVSNQTNVSVLDAGPLDLQIGANEGQFMEIRIPNLSPKALGIHTLNLSTTNDAQLAINTVDKAISQVSGIRAKLGAYQNRLEHTVNNIGVASESMTEAMSRIQDADMAFEMAQYTQKNVIAQAGTSMLAQANQRPQSILQLLQG
ncbi:flagellin N-terminal helical domain-containing protein [Vallitalea sp.]|jgi:flagellin|uniref:flagellin N-terminal helical domain-containing protein n=1 Tax=Vallitalea sp. TaxID=1882829 RepID=UPI0025FD7476|nr:flagellin [Vallitalea sp.]